LSAKLRLQKDRELALLHFVQALKEIEDVDLMQLEKLIRLSQMTAARERQTAQETMNPEQNVSRIE